MKNVMLMITVFFTLSAHAKKFTCSMITNPFPDDGQHKQFSDKFSYELGRATQKIYFKALTTKLQGYQIRTHSNSYSHSYQTYGDYGDILLEAIFSIKEDVVKMKLISHIPGDREYDWIELGKIHQYFYFGSTQAVTKVININPITFLDEKQQERTIHWVKVLCYLRRPNLSLMP
jgi:hypothetical protein